MAAILGENASGLSATNIVRLKASWENDYKAWCQRDLSQKRYVYWWADGVYFNVRLDEERTCVLVLIGATEDGTKGHFILRVIDEPALRMAIERVLNGVEHIHRFTRAVSVGNPREFLQAEKQEQEMAESVQAAYQELHHLPELSLPIPEAGGDG